MTTRINACIENHDTAGEGATLDDALEAIARDCEESAEDHERCALALRTAAISFRARRSSASPAPRSAADDDWRDYHDAGPGA